MQAARSRRVDLVIAGPRGQVGSALCRQLARQQPALLASTRLDLRLLAAFDRHGLAFSLDGLDPSERAGFAPRQARDVGALLDHLCRPHAEPALLVDCTASDAHRRERVAAARRASERWVVLAQVDTTGGRIAPRRVSAASPFAGLPPGQNLVQIRTTLQDSAPLLLGGPGAGPAVTAAGLLSDIVGATRELDWRHT